MTMLHTVNKSPFEKNSLERCLQMAKSGSAVLLVEDGVYAAIKGATSESKMRSAMERVNVYALGPDLSARGVNDTGIIEGIQVVDYGGFVDLVAEHDRIQSWL